MLQNLNVLLVQLLARGLHSLACFKRDEKRRDWRTIPELVGPGHNCFFYGPVARENLGNISNRLMQRNKVNNNDNMKVREDKIPTVRGERVKIPLLPNKAGKRSGTMVMTTPLN